MATYTYTCGACQNVFPIEATLQEKEADNNTKFICPKCQSKNITPIFSVGNFIKNIFQSDTKSGSRCSSGESCCASGKLDDAKECCREKKGFGGCCNSKK